MFNYGNGNYQGYGNYNPYQIFPSQNPTNNQCQNNGIIWIQSEEEAKSYQLIPNSNIALIDGNKNILYLKSCDNMGMCTLKTFNITEFDENSYPKSDMSEYVKREEFEELKRTIENFGGGLNEKFVSANDGQSGKQQYHNGKN